MSKNSDKNKNKSLPKPHQGLHKAALPGAYSTLAAEQMTKSLLLSRDDIEHDWAAEEARAWVDYDQL